MGSVSAEFRPLLWCGGCALVIQHYSRSISCGTLIEFEVGQVSPEVSEWV